MLSKVTRNSLIRHYGRNSLMNITGRRLRTTQPISTRNFFFGPKRVPVCDLSKQSVVQEDGSRKATWLGDKPLERTGIPECVTTFATYNRGREKGRQMMGVRVKQAGSNKLEWKWMTYEQAFQRADNISQAIRHIGIPTGDEHRIGIYSKNRPEWILTDMAAVFFSNPTVPLYDTSRVEDMVYIMNLSELAIVFVDTEVKTKSILNNISKLPFLKYIVQFNPVDNSLKRLASKQNIKLWSQHEFESMGEHVNQGERKPYVPPTPETIATISFTSGTTGKPKGVVLTHQNLCTSLLVCQELYWPEPGKFSYFSYLPLAHIFERQSFMLNTAYGGRIGFFDREPQNLIEDIQSLNPVTLGAVPRVVDKIHKGVLRELQGKPVKTMILNAAMAYKNYIYQKTGFVSRDTWVDKYLLAKVQNLLGSKLRHIIMGAAKTDAHTLYFLQNALGVHVLEGYGQTETTGPTAIKLMSDRNFGNVGPPMTCCQIKLVDVPELGYHVDKNGGEILIKGYNVTPGYFKNPQATKEAFDEDGYMKTGDIGIFNQDGALEIIDRRKNVFKLPQGEFVAPELIEADYVASPFVSQIYVHGDMEKPWLVAVVAPDPVYLASYAKHKHNISGLTFEELCKNEVLVEEVKKHLIAITEHEKRPRYEGIYDVHLTPIIFTADNDLTTPTSKNKRRNLAELFKPQIDAMFEKIEKEEGEKKKRD